LVKDLDFSLILELAGATDADLAKGLAQGMRATKATRTGEERPDYDARVKYLALTLEAKKKIKNKLEVTGENGQPIRFNILAGHGFIPSVPRSNEDITASTATATGGPTTVQDSNLAQAGTKNNNSNN
jgi:hypothetical protein